MPQDLSSIYSLLAGGEADTAGIANALRRRKEVGELSLLSGSKRLAPFGESLTNSADKQTAEVADFQNKTSQQHVLKNYYEGLLKNQEVGEAGQMQRNKDDNATRIEVAKIGAGARLGAGANRPLPSSVEKELNSLGVQMQGIDNLLTKNPYKAEWHSSVPYVRPLKNWMARNAPDFVSQSDKDAQAWTSDFKNVYELVAKNKLFGAALSPTENREWQKAALGENFDKAQVDRALGKIRGILDQQARGHIALHGDSARAALGLSPDYQISGMDAGPAAAAPGVPDAFPQDARWLD